MEQDSSLSRLDRLERSNRGLKVFLLLGTVCFLAVGAVRPSVYEQVAARKFVLVDDLGQIRAELYNNKSHTILSLETGIPGGRGGRVLLKVGLDKKETPFSMLMLDDGNSGTTLTAHDGGLGLSTGLYLYDDKRKCTLTLDDGLKNRSLNGKAR